MSKMSIPLGHISIAFFCTHFHPCVLRGFSTSFYFHFFPLWLRPSCGFVLATAALLSVLGSFDACGFVLAAVCCSYSEFWQGTVVCLAFPWFDACPAWFLFPACWTNAHCLFPDVFGSGCYNCKWFTIVCLTWNMLIQVSMFHSKMSLDSGWSP